MRSKAQAIQHIADFQQATGQASDIDPHVYADLLTIKLFRKTLRLSRCIECPKGGCGKWSFSWQRN